MPNLLAAVLGLRAGLRGEGIDVLPEIVLYDSDWDQLLASIQRREGSFAKTKRYPVGSEKKLQPIDKTIIGGVVFRRGERRAAVTDNENIFRDYRLGGPLHPKSAQRLEGKSF